MKALAIAVILLALCSLSFAGTPDAAKVNNQQEAAALLAQTNAPQAASHSPFSTSACSFPFTSGANDSFLKFCVTENGNITQLETPAGKEHIAVGALGEGYGVCDLNRFVAYFDYADFGDSGNWSAAALAAQTTKSVKITRSTSDGVWMLTQTITQVPALSPSVTVVMTLKNNTAEEKNVFLVRYADVDAGGDFQNNLDGTAKSAFGWNSNTGSNPFGLMLQNTGASPVALEPAGFTQNVPSGPDPCNFATHFAPGTQIATDGSIVLLYPLTIPKHGAKTVTLSYKGM